MTVVDPWPGIVPIKYDDWSAMMDDVRHNSRQYKTRLRIVGFKYDGRWEYIPMFPGPPPTHAERYGALEEAFKHEHTSNAKDAQSSR